MGSDLVGEFAVAKEVFERASDVVGYDLAKLCFEDPDQQLDKTCYTQPALLTHEFACLEALRSVAGDAVEPSVMAGHSLGEYAALVAAGALAFEDAVALVSERGRLMGALGRGSMLATTLDLSSAMALADKHYCGIGGCNLPEQTVVAGEDEDLDALAADLSEQHPSKRAVKLNTEGAFHTHLMVPAAQQFRAVLERTPFAAPRVTVLSNYTGEAHASEAEAIRSRLFFQLFNPVRWVACMNTAIDLGVDTGVEPGGGIGKGEGPGAKRANLESIVKKSLKWREHQAQYASAINAAGIRAGTAFLITEKPRARKHAVRATGVARPAPSCVAAR